MPRPIHATIHPAAIRNNLQVIRRHAPGSRVWAVVKADAYGHGIRRIYPALAGDGQTPGTDGFAMLDLDEAVLVRELGWTGPLLLLEGFFAPGDLEMLDRHRIGTTIHCEAQLRMLETARLTQPLDVHLKMNTGMNRLGFAPPAFRAAWQRLRELPHVGSITLMTHFSDADGQRGIEHQLAAFERGAEGVPGPRSLSNSAATLWHPHAHHDWVRPGIILYGASPSGVAAAIAGTGLQPAMTLASELIGTQDLQPGDTVGYGSRFVADRPMRIGVVACGYADGYPRHAPDGTPVIVGGVRTRLVGRVSMDMLKVDLTPCPQAGIGTPVELWGHQLAIDEVAQACDTIGYELMCALARRVPVSVASGISPSVSTTAA